jgi:ferric-dicitrate binding protein FerR (iron transport regulator)
MSEVNQHMNDDLLVKHLVGETTTNESLQVDVWLAASEVNRKHYDQLKLIWETSQNIANDGDVDEDAAWQRLQNRIGHQAQPTTKTTPIYLKYWIQLAASVILVCTVAWFMFFFRPVSLVSIHAKTSIITDTLPDGSIITLNKASELIYPNRFTNNTRKVDLKGEAFFKVSPDKTKPFIIKINDVTVTVVGTSFNVRTINEKTEVIVETGIVKVSRQQNSIELRPGERVITDRTANNFTKEINKSRLYNYYFSKEFNCDHTPLKELVQALNNAYPSHIVIQNKSLENLQITTVFKDQSLEDILKVISETFKIEVSHQGNQTILK